MIFPRRFAAWTLCAALLCNIEYSMSARAEETSLSPTIALAFADATPMVSPSPATSEVASPERSVSETSPTPAFTPQVDVVAQQLLREMASTYANLKAFSAVATLSGSPVVPRVRATIAWQRPNRYAIVLMKDNDTARVVSDGVTVYQRVASIPGEYSKDAADLDAKTLQAALASSGGGDFLLSNIDQIVARMTSSDFETSGLQSLGLEAQNQIAGVDVVVARVQSAGENGQFKFFIDRKSHLLRRIELSYLRGGETINGVESYASVRINPDLPAATFQFLPRQGDKVFKSAEPVFYDARLKTGTLPFAFEAKDTNGTVQNLAKYRGKVLLLDFWATWCPPCVAEMPNIQAAYDKYRAQGFEIVGVSLDRDLAALQSFVASRKIAWPQIFDDKGAMAKIYGVRAIPFALLVGRDGKIAAVNVRGDDLEIAVKAALAKK